MSENTNTNTSQLTKGLVAADKNNSQKVSPQLAFKSSLATWHKDNVKGLINKLGSKEEVDALMAGFVFAINAQPVLLECKFETLINCLIRSVRLGLDIGNPDECTIQPYKDKAELVPGFQGLTKLAYNSSQVRSVNCGVVFENDHFEYELGTSNILRHIPLMDDDKRGEMVSAWCVIKMAQGDPVIVVKNKKYIHNIRSKSPSFRSDEKNNTNYSPWNTFPEAMWLKTIIKVAMKQAPKSAKLVEVMALDNKVEAIDQREIKPVLEADDVLASLPAPAGI